MSNGFKKINEMITQRMIDRINETGELPWKKPWASVSLMPRNLISKKPYRGVNVFLLHSLGYASPFFLSFKQVTELGGWVRKGERATPVVFFKFIEADEKEDPDAKSHCVLRYYRVFNTAQCDGLDGKVPEVVVPKRSEHEPLEIAERLLADMPDKPDINYARTLASYSPSMDTVSMPPKEWFASEHEFWAAMWHELSHSTGHQSRVGRKAIMEPHGFGSHEYSQEELVSEMSAAFLCGYCGILMSTEKNQAAYLKGWLARLKADQSLLIKAGCQAQRAFDYIVGDAMEQELAKAA
ncbi:ArdC family protein [Pontiella sulfatireligans]|uniref:DNA primase TraC n=1 Tax=Pontiella sulfatireligans TaxID=2750658 RepID=A0A6C2UF50_9BACT|nr:zincin-like metallopeptidase domain-containing protein [Pontiella sulfatireligans]VGO18800.1 DNA primase TraC [Pontiella sulfatireligans]